MIRRYRPMNNHSIPVSFWDPRIVSVKEGARRTRGDWEEELKASPSEFDVLVECGCLKRNRSVDEDIYEMRFVGLLFLANSCVLSLPKVSHSVIQARSDLSLALAAVMKYRQLFDRGQTPFIEPGDAVSRGKWAKLIELFRALLNWTDLYGLHQTFIDREISREGAISWPETIKKRMALHGDTFTVFDRPIYRRRTPVIGELRSLQAKTIVALAGHFYPVLEALGVNRRDVVSDCRAQIDSGDERRQPADEPTTLLRRFLSGTNLDHEIELSRILLAIYKSDDLSTTKGMRAVGTNSFHVIWQTAVHASLLSAKSASAFLSPGVVSSMRQHTGAVDKSWLRPDHVLISRTNPSQVILADSKWHDHAEEFGSYDIGKQMLYEAATSRSKSVIGNSMISPTDSNSMISCGSACIIDERGSPDMRLPAIQVIGAPWRQILNAFIQGGSEEIGEKLINTSIRS